MLSAALGGGSGGAGSARREPAYPLGSKLAAYGKTARDSPFMLQQEEGQTGVTGNEGVEGPAQAGAAERAKGR